MVLLNPTVLEMKTTLRLRGKVCAARLRQAKGAKACAGGSK